MAPGVTVDVHVDVPAARLAIKITSADGSASYCTWAGEGQPMAFDVDTNSDGSIDQTLMASDDGN